MAEIRDRVTSIGKNTVKLTKHNQVYVVSLVNDSITRKWNYFDSASDAVRDFNTRVKKLLLVGDK